MEPISSPFDAVDRILETVKSRPVYSGFSCRGNWRERRTCLLFDGRVAAVLGTHTHVQTADEQILPNGTAFISDVGMTGPKQSVLGVKPECVIQRMRLHIPTRFETAEGPCVLQGVLLDLDEKTGKCRAIDRVCR